MHYYADGGIPWYLIADPVARTLVLYELIDAAYEERSVAQVGEISRLTEPVEVALDPATLLPD